MGFGPKDAAALNAAMNAGLIHTPHQNITALAVITLGPIPNTPDDATLIANTIAAYERMQPNMTIWIDVTQLEIPAVLIAAIGQLEAMGAAIVVTHEGHSSCSEPDHFPTDLMKHILLVKGSGNFYDPLRNKIVCI